MNIRKILVPTDFSENAAFAYGYAREMAQKFDASVILLHVSEPIYYPVGAGQVPIGWESLYSEVTEQADQRLQEAQSEFAGLNVQVMRREGAPHQEIASVAEQEGADLIVIATHGHTGWKHLLIGSTTEKVVRQARCPVLTVQVPNA